MYEIHFSKDVLKDIKRIKTFYRNIILDEIESQLMSQPDAVTKNKKILINLIPPWEAIPPIWELRFNEYRIFYDIDDESNRVFIRAIRKKPQGKTTEEII